MENLEILLEELEKFEKSTNNEDIPRSLVEYLRFVAKTGDPLFPWHRIKNLVRRKLSMVMGDFYDLYGGEEMLETANLPPFSYIPTRNKILQQFDSFIGAPFTIQRICEILVDPMKHYKRTDKFLRGLEKNILVVSCVEPGRVRRVMEVQQQNLVNGLQEECVPMHPPFGSSVSVHPASASSAGPNICEAGEDHFNGSITTNGMMEDNSSSSSSSCSSSSSSPTPDEDQDWGGPLPKRPRLELDPIPDKSAQDTVSAAVTVTREYTSRLEQCNRITPNEPVPKDANVETEPQTLDHRNSIDDTETEEVDEPLHLSEVNLTDKESADQEVDTSQDTIAKNSISEESDESSSEACPSVEQNDWEDEPESASMQDIEESPDGPTEGSPDSAQDSTGPMDIDQEDKIQNENINNSEATATEERMAVVDSCSDELASSSPEKSDIDGSEADSTSQQHNSDDSSSQLPSQSSFKEPLPTILFPQSSQQSTEPPVCASDLGTHISVHSASNDLSCEIISPSEADNDSKASPNPQTQVISTSRTEGEHIGLDNDSDDSISESGAVQSEDQEHSCTSSHP